MLQLGVMKMQGHIRKIGNSAGVILPSLLLKKLHLTEGDTINITDDDGRIMIESVKPKYTLSELISQCDTQSPMPKQINEWEQLEPVGLEAL